MKSFNSLLLVFASSFSLILAQTSTAPSTAPSGAPYVDKTCWEHNKCDTWASLFDTYCSQEAAALGLNTYDINHPTAIINTGNSADVQNLFNCVCNVQPIFDSWAICFGCAKNLPSEVTYFVDKINDPRCKSEASASQTVKPSPAATGSGNGSPSASAGGGGSPSKASGSGGGGSSPSPSPTGGSGGSNSSSGGNKTGSAHPSSTSPSGAGSIICSMALLGFTVIAGGLLLV